MIKLKYPMFDGKTFFKSACVIIDNGEIISVKKCDEKECNNKFFLMPGLIDAHTHISEMEHIKAMLQNGITATCTVGGKNLIKISDTMQIISSSYMAMGLILKPKEFVEKTVLNGAKYIKVLLFNSHLVGKRALNGIINTAHEKDLKVAVHATEIATMKQAVEANADILLHIPIEKEIPISLAQAIAKKEIAIAPTLIMMKAFANAKRGKYKKESYNNAKNGVKLLNEYNVKILSGTDANIGTFTPKIDYGTSLHEEMLLLSKAGLTNKEILSATTSNIADTFNIEGIGRIKKGYKANLILIEGNPYKNIADIKNIKKVWINGKEIEL